MYHQKKCLVRIDKMSELVPNQSRPTPAPIEHAHRRADLDPKIARRVERQVAIMFGSSALLAILFVVAYVGIDPSVLIGLPVVGTTSALNIAMGLTMGGSILLIGTGAIHWAKKLMPDVEVVEERQSLSKALKPKADF